MVARDAYVACERIARTHYENFPVASLLLPRSMRPHVAALYAFARTADDFADEGRRERAQRLDLLASWETRLHCAASGGTYDGPLRVDEPADSEAIFVALGETIRSLSLPVALFEDLLSAFRQDVTVTRYGTWDEVMDYCRRSAHPIGRLVLRIAGVGADRLDRSSDALCAALQLTNFWQDLIEDADRGRIYLPASELAAAGAAEADLTAHQITPAWRHALERAVARTRRLFDEGRWVCDGIDGRLRYQLRATWLGGARILDRLEHAQFDPTRRPTLGRRDVLWIARHVVAWRFNEV